MAYADKCFFFDWGNREIKLKDFDDFGSISLRKRVYYDDSDDDDYNEGTMGISIELWGKEKEDGERYEDKEIVLSKDDALLLASKITRAVAELDADDYRENEIKELHDLNELHRDKLDEMHERHRELEKKYGLRLTTDKKGGIGGALKNFVSTPKGKDAVKKMKGEEK